MPDFLPLDGLLRGLVLALPAVLLVFFVLMRRAKKKPPRATPNAEPLALHEPLAPQPPQPQALQTPDLSKDDPVCVLQARLQDAEARGDKPVAAGLSLELAELLQAHGREKEALAALRSAAGLSAIGGPASVHAEARLALAEAALKAGDLTMACEQWQLARTAYQKGGADTKAGEVDNRMRANGCPTDWVLTDF